MITMCLVSPSFTWLWLVLWTAFVLQSVNLFFSFVSSLWKVEELIKACRDNGRPVAGVVIEPIQGEGGDRQASHEFYRQLRWIAKKVRHVLRLLFWDLEVLKGSDCYNCSGTVVRQILIITSH